MLLSVLSLVVLVVRIHEQTWSPSAPGQQIVFSNGAAAPGLPKGKLGK